MTPRTPTAPTPARRAMGGAIAVFAANGFAFASWASRIPDVKRILDLTPGDLGLLLLFATLGSVVGLPASGRIIKRFGTRTAVIAGLVVSAIGFCVASMAVDIGHSVWITRIAMLAFGLANGLWDVSMNHEGAAVERELGRSVMPWFHAAFSAATVLAALVGSGMVALGVPVWIHVWGATVLVTVLGLWGVARFLPVDPVEADVPKAGSARSAWAEPRTLLIGLVVVAAAFTEGSANDWIAVAMVEGHGVPAWMGVLGFALFLGFMTIGRLVGTSLLDKFGRVPVLRVLFGVAMVGSVLVVFGTPVLAFIGAALWGVGASLGFPVGMSAASDDPERAASRLSVVSTIGYLGFLGGPPLLGFLGDHVGVLHALLAVAILLIPATLALPAVREPAKD